MEVKDKVVFVNIEESIVNKGNKLVERVIAPLSGICANKINDGLDKCLEQFDYKDRTIGGLDEIAKDVLQYINTDNIVPSNKIIAELRTIYGITEERYCINEEEFKNEVINIIIDVLRMRLKTELGGYCYVVKIEDDKYFISEPQPQQISTPSDITPIDITSIDWLYKEFEDRCRKDIIRPIAVGVINKKDKNTLITDAINKRRSMSNRIGITAPEKASYIKDTLINLIGQFFINEKFPHCKTDEEFEKKLEYIITTYYKVNTHNEEGQKEGEKIGNEERQTEKGEKSKTNEQEKTNIMDSIINIFNNKKTEEEQITELRQVLNGKAFDMFNDLGNYFIENRIIEDPQKINDFNSMVGVILKYYNWGPYKMYIYIHSGYKKPSDFDYLAYAVSIGTIDIKNENDLNEFKRTVAGDKNTKFTSVYDIFLKSKAELKIEWEMEIEKKLTARFEAAVRVSENRKFYESDFIKFDNLHSDQQNQSGLHVASNIRNINTKLDNYGRKSEGDKDEKVPAIMYTAFDITFKNTFNLDNPAVSKLAAQGVDLRDDLSRYRIYDQDNNFFDKYARDKYVTEKLIPIGLTPDEIGELGKAVEGLPNEVEKNYEVLSGNFYADQDSFEKISKIYALGEIIDNIKKLFASNETLSNKNKLSDSIGLEGLKLDENKPADIVGDCLLLKGTINGSETNIKYNLRTGKLYMNSFTQESINPPKITIGNTEPDTEIGNLGDFDDLLKGYEPRASLEIEENHPSNDSQYGVDMNDSNNPENTDSDDTDSNQKAMEKLMENKLFGKLSEMGRIVQEKAGEQSRENDVIISFLKTFNILPDDGKLVRSIEFEGGSNLFTLLESIKNTNSETELDEFSVLVNKLMKYCRLSRGNNNLNPATPDSSFVSISDINEENTTPEIRSLIEANKAFFSENGEKDRIKGYESHFDDSVKLSFADIIFNNFCHEEASGIHKISVVKATNFVNSVIDGFEKINAEVTMDSLINDDATWA